MTCELTCEVTCDFYWTGIPRGRPPWASRPPRPPSRPPAPRVGPVKPRRHGAHWSHPPIPRSGRRACPPPRVGVPSLPSFVLATRARHAVAPTKKKLRRWLLRSSAGHIRSSVLSTTILSRAVRGTFSLHRAAAAPPATMPRHLVDAPPAPDAPRVRRGHDGVLSGAHTGGGERGAAKSAEARAPC